MPCREVDPRVRRFLERQAASAADELAADVLEAREVTPAERWAQLVRLSQTLEWIRTQPPEHQARVLERRDPPHPSYRELVARLCARPRG